MIQVLPIVENNPHVMLGKPVFKGSRITIESVLRKLAEGLSINEIIEAYPQLSAEHIYVALEYASKIIANEEVIIPKAS